jgi:hypothetical protein
MVDESGYAASPWTPQVALAVVCLVAGATLAFTDVRLVTRGYAIIVAGVLLLAGGLLGPAVVETDSPAV